jgi:hypothetical protein
MSTQQVERGFALVIGFGLAGCWSVVSGTVLVMALAAFGMPVG